MTFEFGGFLKDQAGKRWVSCVIRAKSNGNIQSLRPSDFALAFGRMVARFAAAVYARLKAVPLSKTGLLSTLFQPWRRRWYQTQGEALGWYGTRPLALG